MSTRHSRSRKPPSCCSSRCRADLLALDVVAVLGAVDTLTRLVLDRECLVRTGQHEQADGGVDLRVVDVPRAAQQMLDRLRRRVIEPGTQHRNRVRVLEQRLEVGARGRLVDAPGVDDADVEVVDLEQPRHHDVDPARKRELLEQLVSDLSPPALNAETAGRPRNWDGRPFHRKYRQFAATPNCPSPAWN
ncbi:hypothetical protein ACQP00_04000 [Dactylosporangium sp. CS-047395]|uniref:hypothetical protein n=1 Tax=Dactylosporangium sp. CS-047395 TaxID=3239936 RepID=UPI003D8DB802